MITSTGPPGQYGIEDVISRAPVHPDYRKTVAHLRADETKLAVQSSALHFTDYAFEPASVFPVGLVQPEQIAEINLQSSCHVRLKSGEILFVRPVYKEEFVTFVNRHQLPVRRRSSVWSALLDPFLDTWEEQQVIDRQFEWFASLGLDRDVVTRWRREVAVAMLAYNFGAHVWEWVRLDLHDALVAQRARLDRNAFADFYARAMTVAAATAHTSEPRTADEALLLDIDLSILGADEATFEEYDHSIRGEYGFVPETRYREARAEVLMSFLRRERLYHTALYRQRLESQARANLQRALARLRTE